MAPGIGRINGSNQGIFYIAEQTEGYRTLFFQPNGGYLDINVANPKPGGGLSIAALSLSKIPLRPFLP